MNTALWGLAGLALAAAVQSGTARRVWRKPVATAAKRKARRQSKRSRARNRRRSRK